MKPFRSIDQFATVESRDGVNPLLGNLGSNRTSSMCGRFTLRTPASELIQPFLIEAPPDLPLRYNIAPTQDVAVVRRAEEGHRQLAMLRWGLVPFWADDLKIGSRMINARSESAAVKPAFRAAFRRRRCLVVADGYFEWKASGKQKFPFYFQLEDQRPFAFAGLWERWQQVETCTILTTVANATSRPYHDRMPVILPADTHDQWLDEASDLDALQTLLVPYESEPMSVTPVSQRVNNVRNDDAECLQVQRELF